MLAGYLMLAAVAMFFIATALVNEGAMGKDADVAAVVLGLAWPITLIYFALAAFADRIKYEA